MKENILDVLMYLFEHYMSDDVDADKDEESLRDDLQEAGFHQHQIAKAFDWLEGLTSLQENPHLDTAHKTTSIRVFTEKEMEKLDLECRGFLMFLENVGVLDYSARELVIDRVMALDSDDVDMEQLKWVVLMVLFNQPGREEAFAWMEDLVFDENTGNLH
jgi:Smg protein